MPISILTTNDENFYIFDEHSSVEDFISETYQNGKEYIEVIVWKRDSSTYPAVIMKDKIIAIRDLSVETMKGENYNEPKY